MHFLIYRQLTSPCVPNMVKEEGLSRVYFIQPLLLFRRGDLHTKSLTPKLIRLGLCFNTWSLGKNILPVVVTMGEKLGKGFMTAFYYFLQLHVNPYCFKQKVQCKPFLKLSSFFLYKIFNKLFITWWGRFKVTIPIRLTLYITYISPIISPQPLPNPPQVIAKGFLVLFYIGIWSPSTIYCHLNLLPSPSPSH
jgi:hypothetical protein